MKKILISSYSLDLGGIETALITLIKHIQDKYEITLVLEKKEGIFLNEVPKNVKIIEFKPSMNKITLLRKSLNFLKQLIFKIKYKNKFDYSVSYATYSYPSSFVARNASKNCYLWVHNDYMSFYNNDKNLYKSFFEKLKFREYKKIIFVSENDKKIFLDEFSELKEKAYFCNNLIDYKKILTLSKEKITDLKQDKVTTFINIGRHEEKQKKLSRIIEASKMLNKEGYKFRVIFIGDGPDSIKYKDQAKDMKNIIFLGPKKNPYPYLKQCDCLLMSSDYEGYPVVYLESMILEKPIITTDVSDSKKDLEGIYGIIANKSAKGIYNAMKEFIKNGFKTKKYDPSKFNENIIEKVNKLFDEIEEVEK